MRLFVAVPLPEPQREHLRRAVVGGRTTNPLLWHLTLAFLGEREHALTVIDALAGIDHPAFQLRLQGNGTFPGAAWAGVSGDLEALHTLAKDVALACGPPDDTYRPHVTVARRGHAMPPGDYEGPTWQVDAFDLVQSLVTGSVEHRVLASFPLVGG